MGRLQTLCLLVCVLPILTLSFRVEYQYGAILDAGSTSTKLHLYRWIPKTVESDLPKFEEVIYKKFKPALGDFVNTIELIQPYLMEILDLLKDLIPESYYDSTPVYLMATAGTYINIVLQFNLFCVILAISLRYSYPIND